MTRTFESKLATREKTPLLVGLIGPSGTGKTFSALRMADGIRRIVGGDVYMIDTEARRSLHYAELFKFHHVAFGAPFGPMDYLAAIEHCLKNGARTIIVDSMSHEHEGPGGVLEMHAAELARMGGQLSKSMLAWQKPKAERRRLINTILTMDCNFIFCFRAKEKLKIVPGKDPTPRGFMPMAGEEFVYELTLKCLLLPGANGVPTIAPEYPDEKMMVKIPGQFRDIFAEPVQLSEDVGEALARWAAGSAAPPVVTVAGLLASYAACSDPATLQRLETQRKAIWGKTSKEEKATLKATSEGTAKRLDDAAKAPPVVTGTSDTSDTSEPPPRGLTEVEMESALAAIAQCDTDGAVAQLRGEMVAQEFTKATADQVRVLTCALDAKSRP